MITKEQQIELWKEFKKLKTDEERWRFIIDNQFKGIRINLDNDDTLHNRVTEVCDSKFA